MKIVLDTNIVLDLLLEREPHCYFAEQIFSLIEQEKHQGFLCATTLTTIDYLLSQHLSRNESRQTVARLLRLFEVAPVNRTVIERALSSPMIDFEDAVMDQSAVLCGAKGIITRHRKDFLKSVTRIFDPQEFLSQILR